LEWIVAAGTMALGIALTQLAFLIPVFRFRIARSERAKPLILSALMLAVVAAALTTGLAMAAAEAWPFWREGRDEPGAIAVGDDLFDEDWSFPLFATIIMLSWIVWSVFLVRFGLRSRRPETWLGRWVGLLLGGTIIEALVILPVDVMVRRRTDCYCATGTFMALLISIVATLWLTGPGVLIALTSKRRRAWYESHCECCGYERGPSPGQCCPECGSAW
jgi:hypothetical protein